MHRPFVLVTLALIAAGCAGDVPSPTLVEDLRVLAVRAEPPELLVEREGAAAPVSFQALVVDPRGPSMVWSWAFCPVESSQTCGDFVARRAEAPAEFQPALDAARTEQRAGQSTPDPDTRALGVDPFTVQIPADLFAYHLKRSGLGLGNGSWVSAVLALQAGPETLLAQKRLVLNARDLSQWNPELAAFGWQVCPPGGDPVAGCLPLAPRTANHNPEIASVEVARSKLADAAFAPLPQGPLIVAPGEVIRLRPVLAPGAEERYQMVESTLQGNNLVVVDHTEETVASWFATGGEFGAEQTTAQRTRTLDNSFTAPTIPPPDGRISLYLVVRDQRGGVGWTSLEVVVE
jgi:hypothetical protein